MPERRSRFPNQRHSRFPNRILVIQTAFLGDVVLTTPLFRELKRLFPTAELDCLVAPRGAEILEGLPELDRIIVHNKRQGSLKDLRRILRVIKRNDYDLVISPHRSPRSAIIVWWSGAPRRVGYEENALPFLYTDRVRRPMDRHEGARILALARPVGGTGGEIKPYLALTDEELLGAKELLGDRPTVAFAPGSAWPTKRWPAERYGELAASFTAEGYRAVLLGSPGDREVAGKASGASVGTAVNLAGRTTVRQMAAIIAGADLLVANDSAPVHMAAAFDVPTVALFGPTVPEMGFRPLSEWGLSLGAEGLECRPCSAHGGAECPVGHFACMLGMDVDSVWRASFGLLEEKMAAGLN
jgi:heptosyltransferase-2